MDSIRWYLSWAFNDGDSFRYEIEEFVTKEEVIARIEELKKRYYADELSYHVIKGEEWSL